MDPDDTSPETAVEADENDPQQHQELDTSNLDIVQAPDEDPNEMEHTENLSNEFIHQTGVPGEREDQDKQSSELDDEKVDEETKEERRLISPPLCSEEEKPDGTTQGSESTLNRVEAEEESFETPASENQAAQSEQDITDQITSPNKVDIVTAGGSQETGCADGHEAAVSGGCAPSFITELTSVEYTAGSALQLVAQVTGQPLPDAVWKKDGAVIDLSGRVNAENEDGALTLSVTLTSPKDAGQYTVEVFNEHGRVKSEAEVVLQKPEPGAPEFSLQVKDVIQTPSGSVEFSARVSGQPKPKVHWQFNDKPIKAGPNYKLERDEDLCKLFISECNEELAGRYACVAKNSAGLARSEATLQVMDQLPVDNTEESVAEVEQPSQLTEELVQAQPERQSRGNEEQIIERKIIREETNVEDNEKTAQRKTKALTEEMENDISHVERRKKTAKKEAPHFLKTIGDTEVFNGMQAKFTACVSGQPLPEFEWYRDGIRIYPSDRIAMSLDETGVVRLVMRSVDSTDAGRYRLRVINSQGEADCEADLTFESFESINIRPMKDQYKTLEWQLKSGVPMPLVDAPIISRMTDCQLVLSWRPSPPVGQTVPVTYQVEMTEVTANEWQVIRTGVRGCSIEVKELFPDKDYRFRVKVENKYGVSEPSAHVTTQREKLIVPLQTPEEFLPSGERFRPGISTKFPENFDMERWNNRRPQPPIKCDADNREDNDSEPWRYSRLYSDNSASVRRPTHHLPQPEHSRPVHRPLSRQEVAAKRPSDTRAPKSARTRHLTDDVDSRRSPRSGSLHRQRYSDEWESKRGAHIVERLMVRHQVEDAGRNYWRSNGFETRRILCQLPASLTNKQRFRFMQKPTEAEQEGSSKDEPKTESTKNKDHQPWATILQQPVGSRRRTPLSDWLPEKWTPKKQQHMEAVPKPEKDERWSSSRDWQGEFEHHLTHTEKKTNRKRASTGLMSVTDWESRFLKEFTPLESLSHDLIKT